MSDIKLENLPDRNDPDYFRVLVRNCIETFKQIPNNKLVLDYNRVSGKLRALILDDEEFIRETRNIYAKQQLEEIQEIEYLARLATNGINGDEGDAYDDPRDRGKNKGKKVTTAEKETLVMRFKAAQMKREILAGMSADANDTERDAVNFMFVNLEHKEIEKSLRDEIYEGEDIDTLDELTDRKEKAPEGTSGKVRNTGKTGLPDTADFFEVLPDGEIVEKE
jgi:hypothetical protein